MKKICFLAILLVFVACKSSSSMMATPPANIAGTYPTVTSTNWDVATFTNCTGALVINEGNTFSDPSTVQCSSNDPFVIVQSGNAWRSESQFVTCPTHTLVTTASGTLNGDRIDGLITVEVTQQGTVQTNTITNGVAASDGTLVFPIARISISGAASGSCSIVPPLERVYSQTRSGQLSAVGLLWEWKR